MVDLDLLPQQLLGSIGCSRPSSPAAGQEGRVETRLGVVLSRLDEPLHLVDDVPAPQGRVVLQRIHPGDKGVVDVGLELRRVGDQTL